MTLGLPVSLRMCVCFVQVVEELKELATSLFPPREWIPKYPWLYDPQLAAAAPPPQLPPLRERLRGGLKTLGYDLLGGFTTGAVSVAQSMAYALLAGLPPVLGLYAGVVPPFLYALLGTSRQLSPGPNATVSLLTMQVRVGFIRYFFNGFAVVYVGLLFVCVSVAPSLVSLFAALFLCVFDS